MVKRGPVKASTVLYSGTLTYIDSATGYITDDDAAGANVFFGVTRDTHDNSAGANGDINCEVYSEGIFFFSGTGFAQDDLGVSAHGVDNFTVALTGGSVVGKIAEVVSATEISIKISA